MHRYWFSTAAFYKAVERAGITDFRWHDLRHTWASWHVQAGTPLPELKELGGWSNYTMVLRYAHLASEHLVEHAERVSPLRAVPGIGAVGTVITTPDIKLKKIG